MITPEIASDLAARLDAAHRTAKPLTRLSNNHSLDVAGAYEIQAGLTARRAQRGVSITGVKLGFTNREKLHKMGEEHILVGRLTDEMAIANNGTIQHSRFIRPKVEPEIAFRLSRDIKAENAHPGFDIRQGIDAVAPAIEIIDLCYHDGPPTYADIVADNSAGVGYAVGDWRPIRAVTNLTVEMRSGGVETRGSTAAIFGDPFEALREMLNVTASRGIDLWAGDVVLAGAAAEPVPLVQGETYCKIAGLGRVGFQVL